jgi:glycosyltransferase involved in cell wall biosynthesis
MSIDTKFRGRIFQVVEALDFGDAVSNQVVALDRMFKELGFESAIYSTWSNQKVAHLRADLADLQPTDEDIVILHFAGYSDHALPHVQELRCTKVCVYHNITPHEFFPPGSNLHEFCLKGRNQLPEVVRDFHYFWGDSSYNLQELIDLGVPRERCAVIPIIVETQTDAPADTPAREPGSWIFLGRVAGNKGHRELVRLFARVRSTRPAHARKLYIVGNYNSLDDYYQKLEADIRELGLQNEVVITGKVDDDDVDGYLARAAIYVSMSEHEGFGVPLIEAARHCLPVLALRSSAVGETLGHGLGMGDSMDDMSALVEKALSDPAFCRDLLSHQWENAGRFSFKSVQKVLASALRQIVPDRFRFSTVSVVICTYNRSDLLERCLDYLQYQTNQNFEVVVVNGPSSDDTERVATKYQHRIKYARNPARNLSISRNMGIELADGDLIAFIDDDAIPFDDWVATLLDEFSSRPLTHAAIGGPAYFSGTLKFQAQDIGINKFATAKVDIDSSEIGADGWERSMLGTNTCFRADVIRNQRGFDEQFDYFLDESEVSFRLQKNNYIIGYAPDLYLRHEFAQSANRVSQYNFNWFSICKNTAYFIAVYSGLTGDELHKLVADRTHAERVQPLQLGLDAGVITKDDFDKYVDAIRSGMEQGFRDAEEFPKTRPLMAAPGAFRVFTSAPAYPLVGRDIDALHICIITKEFPPFVPGGGIGTLYYHLASELLLMGHHVTVVVPGDFASVFRQGRFVVHQEPMQKLLPDSLSAPGFTNNLNWSMTALSAVATIHERQPVDVVDSALWDSEALAFALLPAAERPPLVLRLVTPFPVAARINGWQFPEHEASFFNASEKRLIELADAVVPISDSIADTVEHEHGLKRDIRWTKAYCGIAYWPSFDPWKNYAELKMINGVPLTFPQSARMVLFVGRLERRKGIDLLLEAARSFLEADPDTHLVLAGKDGGHWSTSGMAGMAPELARRVHFVGEVDDATRDKLLHAAYCLVFPSRYESFGLVPLEAFVHGVPVVATRAGAIPEVVIEEDCGLLFEPEDYHSLAHCVTRVLSEPALRARLSEGAKRRVHRLSSRNSAIDAVKLYAQLSGFKETGWAKGKAPSQAMDVSASQSSSFIGSHPRLHTQSGRRDGKSMTTAGAEGFLLYGPYLDLSAGTYETSLFGQVKRLGNPAAYMEVLINSGQVLLASEALGMPDQDGLLRRIRFTLESAAQVEVRVWAAADTSLTVQKLVFIAHTSSPDLPNSHIKGDSRNEHSSHRQ